MIEQDDAAVLLSAAILKASDHEIEALSLEALAADAGPGGLDAALNEATRSERRAGAFGMEIVGAVLVPVLVEAARQFWRSYSGELIDKLGVNAADATITHFKKWFTRAPSDEQQRVAERLATSIRKVGAERGLSVADIEALVVATAPDRLSDALAAQ